MRVKTVQHAACSWGASAKCKQLSDGLALTHAWLDCSITTDAADVEMAECNPQLSATQEACQAELQEIASMCGTSDGAEEASFVQQVGRHLQEEDWHEVLYKVSMPNGA